MQKQPAYPAAVNKRQISAVTADSGQGARRVSGAGEYTPVGVPSAAEVGRSTEQKWGARDA